FNYVVTAHKPTAVTHAVVASFTGPNDVNLITACSTRLEIRTLGPQGLSAVLDVPIYGNISALQVFRPRDLHADLLFILTEKYKFCVLQYDAAKGQLLTRANGDVADRIGRPAENGQLGVVDPACRLIGLHLYDGMLKVIPMDDRSGQLSEAFSVRLEELSVLDMAWLHPQPPGGGGGGGSPGRPLLCVLHQDPKGARHVKTYEMQLGANDLLDGPWQQQHVDSGAALLIPVPSPLGGVVVVGENVVSYLGGPGGQAPVSAPLRQTIVTAWCPVDPDGSRFLLGNRQGGMQLLVLAHDGSRVSGLRTEPLGYTCAPSCLAYLDSGLTFVGSRSGDSQLVRISAQPVNQPPTYLELVDSFPSLAPIVDFVVMDLERQGQGQLVMCSGIDSDGSLRVVRNGIGINRQATVELPGIKGVWSLRSHYDDEYDKYLLLTFVGETRLLALNTEEELDEAELPGFDSGSQTLWCGNMATDHLLQASGSSVRLVDTASLQLVSEWRPAPGFAIHVAAGSPTQVVVATGGGHLVYLEVVRRPEGVVEVVEISNVVLDSEVACVDVSPLMLQQQPLAGEWPGGRSSVVAVGRWDQTMQLLSVPSLAPLSSTPLGGEVIPRSVLCTALEGVPYCMVGLGDGALHTWRLDPATGGLSDKKRLVLGTKPIMLRTFRTAAAVSGGGGGSLRGSGGGHGGVSVFAASDRPTVVYSSNKKLLYSNLNENDVAFLASFHSAAFPRSLAVASEGALTIGTADEIQKLHVRAVPLGENPRRIAHHEGARMLGVLTMRLDSDGSERSFLRLLDDTTFDVVASYALAPGEMPCSLAAWPGSSNGTAAVGALNACFLVGTAFIVPEEPEPTKGRILVLEHVRLVTEKEVKGAAYNVLPFVKDKILASVNSKVPASGCDLGGVRVELASECSYLGNILALYLATRGNLVVVGDLMRSVSLLSYNVEQGVLEHRAADYNSGWTTSVEALDDDTYLEGDNHLNLVVLRRNADSATDEERARLQVVGEYHTGTFVNRFRHGSLVMRPPDSEFVSLPVPLLFGGTDGRLGVIARLPPGLYEMLTKLQSALRQVVRGVGGLSHEAWIAFSNERRTADAKGFVDGDLIETFLDL
ncbi:UV-damaged DNA binding complex subunit 1 protein, partial [Volvox carteri f. nagariensis]